MGEISYHPDTIHEQHLTNTWEIGMRKTATKKKFNLLSIKVFDWCTVDDLLMLQKSSTCEVNNLSWWTLDLFFTIIRSCLSPDLWIFLHMITWPKRFSSCEGLGERQPAQNPTDVKGWYLSSYPDHPERQRGKKKGATNYIPMLILNTLHPRKWRWNLQIIQMKRKIIFYPPPWLWVDNEMNFPGSTNHGTQTFWAIFHQGNIHFPTVSGAYSGGILTSIISCTTVDGRNPAPPGMCKTL